jgi:hypothetical protein
MTAGKNPILLFAAAGALFGGSATALGAGWYVWQRGQQEAAKRLQHQDAVAAKEALQDRIDLAELAREAEQLGIDPDEVIAGYEKLRDSQVSPEEVLGQIRRAPLTD